MSDRSAQYLDGSTTYEHTSASGNTYHLSRNSSAAKSAGVEWSCDCMAWIIQKKRPCKHLKADSRVSSAKGQVIPKPKPTSEIVHAPVLREKLRFSSPGISNHEVSPELQAKFEASRKKITKREESDYKKRQKLGTLRYGFQLAHGYTHEDFVPGQMVAEIKYDGILAMLIDGRIINRSGNDITNRFPEIESTDRAVLVGEIVILKDGGLSDFHAMQERSTDDPMKIRLRSQLTPATFVAFDILEDRNLQHRQTDVSQLAFQNRRWHLEDFFKKTTLKRVQLIEQIPLKVRTDVTKLVETCREMEAEGVMVKRLDAPYKAVRGKNWMKAKTWQEEEFDIIRYGDTGVGKGFTIFVQSGSHKQEVVCNSLEMQRRIRNGHKRVEIKFLSKSAEGAMRFPTLRRLVE